MVIPHTFGGRLNFNSHLHVLVSAGGLQESEGRWITDLAFDKEKLMPMWRFAVITFLREALLAKALTSNLSKVELKTVLRTQYERPAIHHDSGKPIKPHPKAIPAKAQRPVAVHPAGVTAMAIYVYDAITEVGITDAYFSTTYGGWGNGWYLVEEFQIGDWIVVGAPGYSWNSFQGVDGAELAIGLLASI